ncbi:MAG: DUF5103 domain-containing protein [Bacteroidia bacterium]
MYVPRDSPEIAYLCFTPDLSPMRHLLLCATACLLAACPLVSEESTVTTRPYDDRPALRYEDWVYAPDIHTVQFYQLEADESYPVIYLQENIPLVLAFDELMPETQRESDFFVDLVHCDADWQPDNLLPIEYYEGFTQDRIDMYQRSEFTKVPYVHYTYMLPQEGEYFKMSGNYLLKVYRGSDERDLVLTRRFVVADRRIAINLRNILNERVERLSLEELNFDVVPGSLQLLDPARDLDIRLLQNFRWDNVHRFTRPRFIRDNSYEYYADLRQVFRGGNEFRPFWIESTRFYSEHIDRIEAHEYSTDIYLFAHQARDRNTFDRQRDRNGSFGVRVLDWPNPPIQADYVHCHFTLDSPSPVPDGEVYVFGRLSNWHTLPTFQMRYDSARHSYHATALLKQGRYDFCYVVQRPGDPVPDERPFEGPHRNGENFYTILVYYRGLSDRSDQLIGYLPVNYYE